MLQHAQMSHAITQTTTQTTVSRGRVYQKSNLSDLSGSVNVTVFGDVLELDDDGEEYFTQSLVCDFFTLAQRTLREMEACLQSEDVKQLLSRAQYLRGPCATLGIMKVEESCARIEQLTSVADTFNTGGAALVTLFKSARILLDQAKLDFNEAESALRRFYGMV